jgi:hypothetical protein
MIWFLLLNINSVVRRSNCHISLELILNFEVTDLHNVNSLSEIPYPIDLRSLEALFSLFLGQYYTNVVGVARNSVFSKFGKRPLFPLLPHRTWEQFDPS